MLGTKTSSGRPASWTETEPTLYSPAIAVDRGLGATAAVRRIPALDYTKGVLVLTMVLYHWLNYFVSTEGWFYQYLRFLTPSFIFISGFLVSNVYLSGAPRPRGNLGKRLAERGLKLLVLFILLNYGRMLVGSNDSPQEGVRDLFDWNVAAVFLSGNVAVAGANKATAFNILVPIGYLLLLASVAVVAVGRLRVFFTLLSACGLLAVVLTQQAGMASTNLEYITVGLLGIVSGYLPLSKLHRVTDRLLVVLGIYIAYAIIITLWPLDYYLQIVGVLVNLSLIYSVGNYTGENAVLDRHIILLGRYSLFAYIAQIAILQILQRVLSNADGTEKLATSVVLAFALTSMSVVVLEWMRRKWRLVNSLYTTVFG
jgi:peptidoglycan/LPS O-acetylase OafA/YrhL